MRMVKCAGAAGIVLTAWLIASPTGVELRRPGIRPTLELRVITYSSLDSADLLLASETAIALLATAGLHVTWRECEGDSCAVPCERRSFWCACFRLRAQRPRRSPVKSFASRRRTIRVCSCSSRGASRSLRRFVKAQRDAPIPGSRPWRRAIWSGSPSRTRLGTRSA